MEPSRNRLILVVVAVVVILGAFLGGYIPGLQRARAATDEARQAQDRLGEAENALSKTRFDLEVAQLRGTLGEMILEANANNFGLAAGRATAFFDALANAVNNPQLAAGSERRRVLESLLARRDEISADLARAEPTVKTKLIEMYSEFGKAN